MKVQHSKGWKSQPQGEKSSKEVIIYPFAKDGSTLVTFKPNTDQNTSKKSSTVQQDSAAMRSTETLTNIPR